MTTNKALAARLVTEAGELALAMRDAGLRDITSKTNVADVVTEADKAAEQLVFTTLRTERPDDSIVGEEGSNYVGTSDITWVIDPVDGTYNFQAGSDYWCSAIAIRKTIAPEEQQSGLAGLLQQNDAILLSAVYQATTKRLWVGGPNDPTTLNGEAVELAGTDIPLSHACLVTYLHPQLNWREQQIQLWTKAVSTTATWRAHCSASLDMAYISTGVFNVWLMRELPEWDRLPGIGLLAGVGGVSDMFAGADTTWMCSGPANLVEQIVATMTEGES